MNITYLGDSVYVEKEAGMIKLYLYNGNAPHNTIYLEYKVWQMLALWVLQNFGPKAFPPSLSAPPAIEPR